MSVRIRTAFISAIVLLLFVSLFFVISTFFTQQGLTETIKRDLLLSADILDDLVSTKVDLLRAQADTVAAVLDEVEDEERIKAILDDHLPDYDDFLALTVVDRDGVVAEAGVATTDAALVGSEYAKAAFEGESVISTTRIDEDTGTLVMHVCVPIDAKHVLSVTIDGMTFSDLLSPYRLWDSGHVYMIDETGTVLANYRTNMVTERRNYTIMMETDPTVTPVGNFVKNALAGESGFDVYNFDGGDRLCYFFVPHTTAVNWRVVVVAPLAESPAAGVQNGLNISAFILGILGIIAAIILSVPMSEPYYKVHEQAISLEEASNAASKATEAKSQFLANMSHEMRTPLNAIIGLSELTLDSDTINEQDRNNVEKVYASGMILLTIINDILDLSKIESGNFDIVNDTYDVSSMINDTANTNIVRIGTKPIEFKLDVSPDLPCKLFGDELRIKQVFNNLLSNAFKYTRSGTVVWKIWSENDEEGAWLVSSIIDTGIGIKEEDVKRLFAAYNQVDVKSNRSVEGTGLGLSIALNLVQAMRGRIDVQSEYGVGSTFTVRMFQGLEDECVIGKELADKLMSFNLVDHKRNNKKQLQRMQMPYARVLVVDDVPTNLDVVRGILKPYAMQVDCVLSGEEAVSLIKGGYPIYDAILMDHMMPAMDGVEATAIIRSLDSEYARTIPILALTANAIVGNEEMFLSNGFQAFLSKPIDIVAMDAALRRFVRDKDKERRWQEEHEDASESASIVGCDADGGGTALESDADKTQESSNGNAAISAILFGIDNLDVRVGLSRFSNDVGLYCEVLESYLKNTPSLLDTLRATAENDLEAYAICVHGMKSSSRNIGCEEIGAAAEALEKAAKTNDVNFVAKNNEQLIYDVESMLDALRNALVAIKGGPIAAAKERKSQPDLQTLIALRDACANFRVDAVDSELSKLNNYTYARGSELIEWLSEQAVLMNYEEMRGRLDTELALRGSA
jgi:signal transduction histidine kinase/DNA-binding response OmpR family regulator/HPt (histidine-containing phosphotransfer) domain-containing protein